MGQTEMNEGIRIVDDFVCRAILDPSIQRVSGSNLSENEGFRVIKDHSVNVREFQPAERTPASSEYRTIRLNWEDMRALQPLLTSLEDIPAAVCLVGRVLVVKATNEASSQVEIWRLTSLELDFLSKNPQFLTAPDVTLNCLSELAAVAELQSNKDRGSE